MKIPVFWIGVVSSITAITITAALLHMYKQEAEATVVVIQELQPPEISQSEVLVGYMRERNDRLPVEITTLIAEEIIKASEEHDIPLPLLVGLVEKESTFNPLASASIPGSKTARARGLTQIYQGEGIEVDISQAYDLGYNLATGCYILNKKIELNSGDLESALKNYSGNAAGYSDAVLRNAGRFTLYTVKKKETVDTTQKIEEE